jgi:hypothetical protein
MSFVEKSTPRRINFKTRRDAFANADFANAILRGIINGAKAVAAFADAG